MIFASTNFRPDLVPLNNRESPSVNTWTSLQVEGLFIVEGSALDLEALRNTAEPAGSKGRIIVHASDSTQLAETDFPTTPVHLRIATWSPDPTYKPLPSDLALITRAVENLARHGYNAMRVHGLEMWLMNGTVGDFTFPADRLDLFDWFLAELKRVGIYWIIEIRQDQLFYNGYGSGRFSMPPTSPYCRTRIFVEQAIRDHWKTGVGLLYDRVNNYTGINILQDPALFLFECYNENSASFHANSSWPIDFVIRQGDKGNAAQTWPEWIEEKWSTVVALNSAWGTAYGAFSEIPTPGAVSVSVITSTQETIDSILYLSYLDNHLMNFFKVTLRSFGYQGLVSSLIDFPTFLHLRNGGQSLDNDVVNLHNYPFLTDEANNSLDRDSNTPIWGSDTRGGFQRWAITSSSHCTNKPAYFGEFGWPYWGTYRNQYPFLAAFGAHAGAPAISHYAQGNFFGESYDQTKDDRYRILYPYYTHTDPVIAFTELASLFAHRSVSLATYTENIIVSDRYSGINETGTSPRTAARVNRIVQDLFLPTQSMAGIVRVKLNYSSDNTNDDLAAIWNAKSWLDLLNDLKTAGAITATNKAWISANANNGTITAVETSGVIGSVTASATKPVLTIGSNTLVDYDHIAIRSLTGSSGTWPGTSLRGQRAYVLQTGVANKVQIVSGLTLTGASGFTAGSWCEWDNVLETANSQIYMSRRDQLGYVVTSPFLFFAHSAASFPIEIGALTISSLTPGAAMFIASLDGLAITISTKILIGMVGTVINSGESYDSKKQIRTVKGVYPMQITDSTADISLELSKLNNWNLYRLARNGRRIVAESPISINAQAGLLNLKLRSGVISPTTMWELVR